MEMSREEVVEIDQRASQVSGYFSRNRVSDKEEWKTEAGKQKPRQE